MTLLGNISQAFAAGDRLASALIGMANGRPVRDDLLPIPAGRPVQLADRDGTSQLISYRDVVSEYAVVYAVWAKIVRTLSTTDIGVWRTKDDGTEERVHGTSLEALLHEPAPGLGLINLLQWLADGLVVEGNSVIAIYRPDGPGTRPEALIGLDWRYLSAWSLPGGPVEAWLSTQLGEARELAPSDVIHAAWHAPGGSPIGLSPIQPIGCAVRLLDSGDRYQIASFDNGSRPLGMFVLPADSKMDEPSKQRLRERAEARHKGVDKAFGIGLLSGGVKWEKMSFSAAEAEMTATREQAERRIYAALDMRRGVVEDVQAGGTLGAVQERNRDFQRTLIPIARLIDHALNTQLVRGVEEWAGLKVRLDLSELQRGTYREELEASAYGMTNGVLSEREARGRIGLGPSGNPDDQLPKTPHAQLDPNDGRRQAPSAETPPGRTVRGIPEVTGD